MAERPDFQRWQYAFAAHIRDPVANRAPAGVEDRRMAVYRELFFNNLSSLLATTFKVTRKTLGLEHWNVLVRDFMAHHECHTPLFLELPKEFLQFLASGRESPDDPPYLEELAHYEWVELALSIDEQEISAVAADAAGDLLADAPVVSPLAWLIGYHFPVHRIGPEFRPESPGDERTWLCVYRRRDDRVGFMELNTATARLFELARDNDRGRSGRELLLGLAAELGHGQPEAVIAGGRDTLERMRALDIVLGTRGVTPPR